MNVIIIISNIILSSPLTNLPSLSPWVTGTKNKKPATSFTEDQVHVSQNVYEHDFLFYYHLYDIIFLPLLLKRNFVTKT